MAASFAWAAAVGVVWMAAVIGLVLVAPAAAVAVAAVDMRQSSSCCTRIPSLFVWALLLPAAVVLVAAMVAAAQETLSVHVVALETAAFAATVYSTVAHRFGCSPSLFAIDHPPCPAILQYHAHHPQSPPSWTVQWPPHRRRVVCFLPSLFHQTHCHCHCYCFCCR